MKGQLGQSAASNLPGSLCICTSRARFADVLYWPFWLTQYQMSTDFEPDCGKVARIWREFFHRSAYFLSPFLEYFGKENVLKIMSNEFWDCEFNKYWEKLKKPENRISRKWPGFHFRHFPRPVVDWIWLKIENSGKNRFSEFPDFDRISCQMA